MNFDFLNRPYHEHNKPTKKADEKNQENKEK